MDSKKIAEIVLIVISALVATAKTVLTFIDDSASPSD
jgi:hypothetical protein